LPLLLFMLETGVIPAVESSTVSNSSIDDVFGSSGSLLSDLKLGNTVVVV
jgi:hypothetical protein